MARPEPHPLAAPGGVFGSWCSLASPLAAELVGQPGAAYVCVDLQHGSGGLGEAPALLQAISTTGAMPLVRVPGNEPWLIGRALDLGARGVIVPLVSTANEAARAAQACRYPPEGVRSWGAVRTSGAHGATAAERNAAVLCIVMIETVEGVANLESICATAGVDAVYVGPRDLALSHGLEPGPELEAVIHGIAATCARLGIPAGIHTRSGERARHYVDAGFAFATVSSDRDLLAAAAHRELSVALGGEPPPPGGVESGLLRAASYLR